MIRRKLMNRLMSQREKKRRNSGFTLVEAIIVIAILAMLAAAVTLAVIKYIEKARLAMDVHNASMIKNAINVHPFPSDFQGRDVWYTDPVTGDSEMFKRGWVYVDKEEIRCSDPSCAMAIIEAGLVYVSPETERGIKDCEEGGYLWFPPGPDHDYIRRSAINEYVFHNDMTVKARTTWNTYQLDVYIDEASELHLGGSASNAERVGGHAKDSEATRIFATRVGLDDSKVTPIGEQHSQ